MKTRKTLSLLLLIALLLPTAAGCGDSGAPSDTAESSDTTAPAADGTTTAAPETTVNELADELPENLSFEGTTVTFLYRAEKASEFWAESTTGESVNDAIYDNLEKVRERLSVKIDVALRDGHYNPAREVYMGEISNAVRSDDDTYDWVDLMIGNAPVKMGEGIFLNLLKNPYLDFDKPYYLRDLVDTVGLNNGLYFTSGDASLGYIKTAFCMFFNQKLADDYGIGNLYEMVDQGTWTLDALMEIVTKTSQDVNMDNRYDLDDKLGFVVHDMYHTSGFLGSNLIEAYKKNDEGVWALNLGTERDADAANKVYRLVYGTNGSYYSGVSNGNADQLTGYNKVTEHFVSGNVLVMTAEFDDAVACLGDMKDDFGVLPYPKYDEAQEDYGSMARNTHNAFGMLTTSDCPDAAGAVLEALSSANAQTVFPAYYETALKVRYSRDSDSARMYDIIRGNMRLDFGYTYSNVGISGINAFLSSIVKENTFASQLASRKTTLEAALKKYMKSIEKLDS